MPEIQREYFVLEVEGVPLRLAASYRPGGAGAPVVFLHGFGGTKEDYADAALLPAFKGHTVLAYDAPGCGESECGPLSVLSIPFLRAVAGAVIAHYEIARFHLVGHSMGGLTALMLAGQNKDAILSFTNIEGNLAPEDCFLSRKIIDHPADGPEAFLEALVARTRRAPRLASALYAAGLGQKVRAGAVEPIFRSMVRISDDPDLLARFTGLPCPKMFVYGDENGGLSYLAGLRRAGVKLGEIPGSGHFPMYSNPIAMWARISDFVAQVEKGAAYD